MVPSDLSEPPRSEVAKAMWFTEGVSFTFQMSNFIVHQCTFLFKPSYSDIVGFKLKASFQNLNT